LYLDDLNGSYYLNNNFMFVSLFFEIYFGFNLLEVAANDL